MDFKKHLEVAWSAMLSHLIILVFMTLAMLLVDIVTFGILAPVTLAGYMHALLLMIRQGREPRIQDLFSQMHLFLPLLGFAIAAAFITFIGFLFLIVPGILIAVAITFTCLYMIPLLTDKRLGLMESIRQSYAMTMTGNIGDQAIVAILFIGISAIGSSFFIGALFTQPFATIFLLSTYEEKVSLTPR